MPTYTAVGGPSLGCPAATLTYSLQTTSVVNFATFIWINSSGIHVSTLDATHSGKTYGFMIVASAGNSSDAS